MLDSVLERPLKIMKFSGGANHRDCYNALRLFTLTLEPAFFLYIEKRHKQKPKTIFNDTVKPVYSGHAI